MRSPLPPLPSSLPRGPLSLRDGRKAAPGSNSPHLTFPRGHRRSRGQRPPVTRPGGPAALLPEEEVRLCAGLTAHLEGGLGDRRGPLLQPHSPNLYLPLSFSRRRKREKKPAPKDLEIR